jgi:hypothetical protein
MVWFIIDLLESGANIGIFVECGGGVWVVLEMCFKNLRFLQKI